MTSYYLSGYYIMFAQASEYTWMARKLCSDRARIILNTWIFEKINLIECSCQILNLVLSAKLLLILCFFNASLHKDSLILLSVVL